MLLCPPLLPQTVHLWQIELEPVGDRFPECLIPENHQLAREVLSDEEFGKASRFISEPLRLRYAAAHVALRFILGGYLKIAPQSVVLTTEKMGRPIVDFSGMQIDPRLHFNLSHTENIALVAVAGQWPIGVDIERIRPMDSRPGIERQVYTEAERNRLQDVTDSHWFDYWTAKEAVLKATGYGFYLNPRQIELAATLHSAVANEKSGPSNWLLHRCSPAPQWSATLATSQPIDDIVSQIFSWPYALLSVQ